MTVIAWDGKTLAADKQTNFGGLRGKTTKVHRIGECLVGCAGITAQITEMLRWIENGRKPEDLPASQRDTKDCVSVLVVEADGSLSQYENTAYPILLENTCWAIGSGRDFALAAMHLGKNAREAVEVACHFDMNCGNGIDTLELE